MQKKIPLIEERTTADIAKQTQRLLKQYLQNDWNEEERGGEVGVALTEIFAHYCGLVVDRINRAPEKNFLAFLDLLGNSLVSPKPAQVPVTFFSHVKLEDGINIPKNTRIKAEPGKDNDDPVIFETTRDLWMSTLVLSRFLKQIESKKEETSLDEELDNVTQLAEPVFNEKNIKYIFTLVLPDKKRAPVGQSVTMFFYIDNPVYDPEKTYSKADTVPPLTWKYTLNNEDWNSLLVEDETQSLTQTGTVTFLVPENFVNLIKISIELPEKEETYSPSPTLQWVAINTVVAVQSVTVHDEVLGSSNGNPDQKFFTVRKPVLDEVILQVVEHQGRGIDSSGRHSLQADWIDWKEVSDFYGSTAFDRHFVLNHTTGEVRFGDGQNGMIPPLGTRNLRMKFYRAGGGWIGNVSAGSMKTLLAGAKGVDKIVNYVAATGGADAETYDAFMERAPKALRHRGRAVAYTDYEDLAQLASAEVARALCVPLLDLSKEPYKIIENEADAFGGAGKVSLIIVPRSDEPRPLPSQILMQRVENYLLDKKPATTSLSVVGSLYIAVDIALAIELESLRLAATIEHQLMAKMAAFLHPLTGRDGKGWPFGRKPHKSDIYRLVKSISGIKYTKKLDIAYRVDPGVTLAQIERTNRFLVYSGKHEITF